ncbi:hypothetical protein [Woodsholea maritima]|uniref:hypothetical protein n=1 Tax=Woodsholea maritima TaxID=240237 RepID=UPI00036DB885|nr:hypothetical protein [Woodsholea maritima]
MTEQKSKSQNALAGVMPVGAFCPLPTNTRKKSRGHPILSGVIMALTLGLLIPAFILIAIMLVQLIPTSVDVKTALTQWGGLATLVIVALGGSLWRVLRP